MSKERITLAELAEQMREVREGLFALRADLREALNAAETLAQRREKKAARQARWRASNGPNNAANVDATKTLVASTERKEGEERNLPPTPPNKREEGERKDERETYTPARASEPHPNDLTPDYSGKAIMPVTYEQLLSAARSYRANVDEAYVRDVYNKFVACGWRDANNKPFNPCFMILVYLDHRKEYERRLDPDRIPDARKAKGRDIRPANWLAVNKENEDGDMFKH